MGNHTGTGHGLRLIHGQLLVDERGSWNPDEDGFWTWTCPSCNEKTAYLAPVARNGAGFRIIEGHCAFCPSGGE